MDRVKVGIIGPGNIGTDLMYKVMRSKNLEMRLMSGIVESEGIKRAARLGVKTSIRALSCSRRSRSEYRLMRRALKRIYKMHLFLKLPEK